MNYETVEIYTYIRDHIYWHTLDILELIVMLKLRPYLLFLKKGIPSSIILFLLGVNQVPLCYIINFILIACVIVFCVYYIIKLLYKRKTNNNKCFRFKFVIEKGFWNMLKKYGLPLSLVLIIGMGLTCIPWIYLWKMTFVLYFSFLLSYNGTIALYNLMRK